MRNVLFIEAEEFISDQTRGLFLSPEDAEKGVRAAITDAVEHFERRDWKGNVLSVVVTAYGFPMAIVRLNPGLEGTIDTVETIRFEKIHVVV